MSEIKSVLKAALGSKKFLAFLAGVIVWVLNKAGVASLSETDIALFLGLVGTYILGQGVADHGKEAAKVHGETAKQLQAESKKAAAPDPS